MSCLLDTFPLTLYNITTNFKMKWDFKMNNKICDLEKHNISQKKLGDLVDVSRQAINAIENGKYEPSLKLAYRLSQYFKVSIEELFDLKENEQEDANELN